MYDPEHSKKFDFGMLCSDSSDEGSGNEADSDSDSSSDGDSDVIMSDYGADEHPAADFADGVAQGFEQAGVDEAVPNDLGLQINNHDLFNDLSENSEQHNNLLFVCHLSTFAFNWQSRLLTFSMFPGDV